MLSPDKLKAIAGGRGLDGAYDHISTYCSTLLPMSKLDQYLRLGGQYALCTLGRTLQKINNGCCIERFAKQAFRAQSCILVT